MRIFPKVATVIFWTFMILMVIVTVTAYSRRSGHTGLDMAKIQELRSGTKEIPTEQTANN
ncbi:MAG: hypothetical protein H0U49_04640 [Parachlamydiaceae bacterium]|nr:hypothetical protein [Parachlamydiaceae bacterium]